jgi:hypothetical protein
MPQKARGTFGRQAMLRNAEDYEGLAPARIVLRSSVLAVLFTKLLLFVATDLCVGTKT